MKQKLTLNVFGQVQGVDFRSMVKTKAVELKLTGLVRNNSDNSVLIEAEGQKEKLEDLVEWINRNPGYSKITKIEDYWNNPTGQYNDFRIDYSL